MTDNKNSHGFFLETNSRCSDIMDHPDFNTVQHEFSRSTQPHDLTLTSMHTPRNQNSTYDTYSHRRRESDCPTLSMMSDPYSVKVKGQEFMPPTPKGYQGQTGKGIISRTGIISPPQVNRAKEVIDFTLRSKKLITLIDQAIGSGNPRIGEPFDIPRIEKQALLYLKFEDDQVLKYRKSLMPILSFKRIIAGSCYLQYFQGNR